MEGRCYICQRWRRLEEHHVYPGTRRKISERYGAKVKLCHFCHNEPPDGVHFNEENRLKLQKAMQLQLMDKYNWTVEDFRRIFYKSYI